ncbi:hypothetical protein JCM10296v2_000118 [Rhodotorula toruloides]
MLRSLCMSTKRAGLIELLGFLGAQQASELELLETEVIHPPSSRSAAYTASMDALRQIDAICGSHGIVLAHDLPVPEVAPPLEDLPSEDSRSSDDDSLDYDAEDDERFAAFWSEAKRKEVFGHNATVDGTEDARTSSPTAEGKS